MDEVESDNDEIPCRFFTKQAMLFPKKSAEELQAAAELMAKIQEENSEKPVKSVKRTVSPKSRARKNPRRKDQKSPQEDKDSREDDITEDSFTEVSLSTASRRRLKKLQDEQLQELKRIEAENQKILSSLDVNLNYSSEAAKETTEDFQNITVLTIMHMSKVSRLKCFENDKFVDIFPKIAELFNLKVTEFLLCLQTKNITVDDTPKSLGITDKDILECIPYKPDVKSEPDAEDTGNTFKISFQTKDAKDKIEMVIHKVEKMQEIMKRYSEQRNIPLDQLLFCFDGEKISGKETPAELDMESESCVDVTVLEPPSKVRKKRGRGKGKDEGKKNSIIPECITL